MLKIEQRGNRKENKKRKETKSTSYDLDITLLSRFLLQKN